MLGTTLHFSSFAVKWKTHRSQHIKAEILVQELNVKMLQHLHLHLHCASDLTACIGDNQTDQEDRYQFNCHLTSTLKQWKFFTVIKRPRAKYTVFQHFQLYIIVRGCFIGVLNLILQEPAKQCVTN